MQVLRDRLLIEGAVTQGFTGIDVRPALADEPPHTDAMDSTDEPEAGLEHVVVVLRWRQDPHRYAIAVPLVPGPAGPPPPGVHEPSSVYSLQSWAEEVVLWLMEELDTGLVRRAGRSTVGELTFLSTDTAFGTAAVDVMPHGYHLGPLYLGPGGGDGEHLARAGLDVATARHLLSQGRLLTWLHAYVNNARGEPYVGHAVVARPPRHGSGREPGPARLAVLQLVPGTPGTVAAALTYHAVHEAVEAGAQRITSTVDDPALEQVGFHRTGGAAEVSVSWHEVRRPDLHHGSTRA
ncbi:hypothetical protein GCM10027586_00170 [Kineococcus gypseus]